MAMLEVFGSAAVHLAERMPPGMVTLHEASKEITAEEARKRLALGVLPGKIVARAPDADNVIVRFVELVNAQERAVDEAAENVMEIMNERVAYVRDTAVRLIAKHVDVTKTVDPAIIERAVEWAAALDVELFRRLGLNDNGDVIYKRHGAQDLLVEEGDHGG